MTSTEMAVGAQQRHGAPLAGLPHALDPVRVALDEVTAEDQLPAPCATARADARGRVRRRVVQAQREHARARRIAPAAALSSPSLLLAHVVSSFPAPASAERG